MRIGSLALVLAATVSFAATVDDPMVGVETVAGGLIAPTGMAFIGPDDILVLQQIDGTVLRVTDGVVQPNPVLDLPVDSALLDRGLLGIALDPDFANDGFVYLNYVRADQDGGPAIGIRLERYRWDGTALVEPHPVMSLAIRPNVFRIGGFILFGADDKLYTVTGDQQQLGKLENVTNGANPDDTSSILRTFSDGVPPNDNPFFRSTGALQPLARAWSYGIRNSFGMAVDPVTGDLWDTENGQESYDEINRVVRGENSGWVWLQGPDSRDPDGVGNLWMAPGAVYSDPEFSWSKPVAPTSIAFVRNPRLGCDNTHDVLVATTNCGLIEHFEVNASRTALTFAPGPLIDLVADNNADMCGGEQAELSFGSDFGIVTDIETGPDGNLYVLSADQGVIYRLKPNLSAASDADGDGVATACDCAATDPGAWGAPGESRTIRVSKHATTRLGWDDPRPDLGAGTASTVVSGKLSDLRALGDFSTVCRLGGPLAATTLADARATPPPGDGFYYLVRAGNSCGAGTYGGGRAALDGAVLPACAP
ncbi:MAG TPA: PQQ-dependent sugar dehydrogenase [Candidatus Polarisedimenticolaceae bacterium]|nr:PQQ-dependent sugar dehydrogenase [Candidatus Polarisedimenticolaceae bacterium]